MIYKLSKVWRKVLQGWPEAGMGYHKVEVEFDDGMLLSGVIARNCEELDLPNDIGISQSDKIKSIERS